MSQHSWSKSVSMYSWFGSLDGSFGFNVFATMCLSGGAPNSPKHLGSEFRAVTRRRGHLGIEIPVRNLHVSIRLLPDEGDTDSQQGL